MLRNVRIVKFEKLYPVNLYVFLSALYTLQYVPIVSILVLVYFSKKKKKKEKRPILRYGKNTKVMPQYPTIYLFLGKGGESLCLKNLTKKLSTSALSALSMKKIQIQTKHGRRMSKLPKNKYIFPREFCNFPVTEGNKI